MNKCQLKIVFLILTVLLFLTGCNPDSGNLSYEIEYISGNMITGYTDFTKPTPIEGSELQLYTEHISGKDYVMYLQDAGGELLYTFNEARPLNRGQFVNGELWICAEGWTSVHQKQFLDTKLKEGTVYQIDIDSGEITLEENVGENEFFLTINDGRCYFYHRGKGSEEKLFGLVTTPSKNAEIYYRDITDWGQRHAVYTFDYAELPQEAAEDPRSAGRYIMRFSIGEEGLKAILMNFDYDNNGKPVYDSLWSVDISYLPMEEETVQ